MTSPGVSFSIRLFVSPATSTRTRSLTVEDVDLLLAEIRESVPRHWFDISEDGTLDIDDLTTWVHELNNTWIGDANLDGEFNSSDLVEVLSAGTYELDVDAGWASGDFDGSGRFDSSDLDRCPRRRRLRAGTASGGCAGAAGVRNTDRRLDRRLERVKNASAAILIDDSHRESERQRRIRHWAE